MVHKGPAGMRRPLVSCEPRIAFQIDDTLTGDEKQDLEDSISSQTDVGVSVEEGVSVEQGGSTDIIFSPGSSRVDDETFSELQNILRAEGVQIAGWRIGSV